MTSSHHNFHRLVAIFAAFVVALVEAVGEQEVADALRAAKVKLLAGIASGDFERDAATELRGTIADAIDSVFGSAAATVRSVTTQAGLVD
jgi:hypothetical protein